MSFLLKLRRDGQSVYLSKASVRGMPVWTTSAATALDFDSEEEALRLALEYVPSYAVVERAWSPLALTLDPARVSPRPEPAKAPGPILPLRIPATVEDVEAMYPDRSS